MQELRRGVDGSEEARSTLSQKEELYRFMANR